jgi:hypothetical protein
MRRQFLYILAFSEGNASSISPKIPWMFSFSSSKVRRGTKMMESPSLLLSINVGIFEARSWTLIAQRAFVRLLKKARRQKELAFDI